MELSIDLLKTRLGSKGYQAFLKKFTVVQKLPMNKAKYGFPISCRAYKQEDSRLIIPRVYASAAKRTGLGGDYTLNDSMSVDIDLGSTTFYDYQEAAINYIVGSVFPSNENCCYLQMGTGLGKTRTAIGLIATLSLKTLVIVPARSLQSQWLVEISKLAPDTVTMAYQNSMGEDIDCDIAVCVVNTFRGKSEDFLKRNQFGLVIFDEVHEFYTKANSQGLWLSQKVEYVLGLSATPEDKPDKLDTFVFKFLGKPIYSNDIPGFDPELTRFNGAITRINYSCDLPFAEVQLTSAGTPCNATTLSTVLSDEQRLKMIAQLTKELYDEGHGTFVFCEFRDYVLRVQDALMALGIDNIIIEELEPVEVAVLRGGVSSDYLESVRKKGAKIVLTTYGYSRRGVSLPTMTAMVLASPRRNGLTQILGRITRKGDDSSIIRKVIDIVDVNTMYKAQFYERNKVYKQKEWPVEIVTTDFSDLL